MKKSLEKTTFILVLVMVATNLIGCLSTNSTKQAVRYSFAKNEDKTCTITFLKNPKGLIQVDSVLFINFKGSEMSKPEKGTYWEEDTVIFPAGVSFKIKVKGVHVRLIGSPYSQNKIFECPPLEAGKEYQLEYQYHTFGPSKFILTNKETGETISTQ